MTGAPRFSVIINIYNGTDFLREAIDSVLAQSCADWELILWDDGSTDSSAAICAAYADARIRRFTRPRNGGLGIARNQAIAAAHGEWIAFLDQDDIWLPEKLALQDALIRQDRSGRLGLVYGRTTRFDAAGRAAPFDGWFGSGRLPEGDILAQLLAKPSFIAFSSTVFLADALRALGPIPERIQVVPDYYLTALVCRQYRAACLQAVCCRYRVHGASMSHVFKRAIHEEAIDVLQTMALPGQHRLVRRRRAVHESWIGVEQIRAGDGWGGVGRILRRGSIAYLALRPLVLGSRGVREKLRKTARLFLKRRSRKFS
jgi:glycosyltransferase involved in cell wall biosynthesis